MHAHIHHSPYLSNLKPSTNFCTRSQALEKGADGVVVKPYQEQQVVSKLLTLMAEAAEARLQHQALEELVASWPTLGPGRRPYPFVQQELTSLSQASCLLQPQHQLLQPSGQQLHEIQRSVGSGGQLSEDLWQREQELEVEREWAEDDCVHTTASCPANFSQSMPTPLHPSLEAFLSSASLHPSKVCFTAGWAGKPRFSEDHDRESHGAKGFQESIAGSTSATQQHTDPENTRFVLFSGNSRHHMVAGTQVTGEYEEVVSSSLSAAVGVPLSLPCILKSPNILNVDRQQQIVSVLLTGKSSSVASLNFVQDDEGSLPTTFAPAPILNLLLQEQHTHEHSPSRSSHLDSDQSTAAVSCINVDGSVLCHYL